MTVSHRAVRLAALAAGVGLVILGAPTWAGCPVMGGGSSGDNHPQSPDASRDNSDNHDNRDAERQRRDVEGAAGGGAENSDDAGVRSSGGETDRNRVNQIDALAQAQAAGNADACRGLKSKLAELAGDNARDPYDGVKHAQIVYDRLVQMTPAMLDSEIAKAKQDLDRDIQDQEDERSMGHSSRPVDRAYSFRLSFLMDMRAALALGLSQDGPKNAALKEIAHARQAADADAAERRAKIHDLEAQIAELACPAFAPANTASNQ